MPYNVTARNFRLKQIKTTKGPATHWQYDYDTYAANGRLTALIDNGFKGTGNAMDASADYTYDGLGRLTRGSGDKLGVHDFEYDDHLGNLTKKDGKLITYLTATKPHTPKAFGSTSLSHDANGNRHAKGGQQYDYDYRDPPHQREHGRGRLHLRLHQPARNEDRR